MKRFTAPLVLLLMLAAPVWAAKGEKDALTPTDIVEFGQVAATLSLNAGFGTAKIEDPSFNLDLDRTSFEAELEVAIGLGLGFEIELMMPYAFTANMEGDGDSILGQLDFEDDEEGIGDLTAIANYRIFKEDKDKPTWIVGGIVVLPTGDDDISRAEMLINGVPAQQGDEGGIGEGVFQFGLQTGISKTFDNVEAYLMVGYLFPTGEREDGDTEIDVGDVLSAIIGAEIELSDEVCLDVAFMFNWNGEQVEEDTTTGTEETEEAFFDLAVAVSGRFHLSEGWTLVVGVNAMMAQDHDLDEDSGTKMEDQFNYGGTIGIHYLFGAGK